MRSLSLFCLSALTCGAACSTPDRAFPSEDVSSTATASSATGTPTTSTDGAGTGGDGGNGDGGGDGNGGDGASSPESSSSQGGGPPGCGNGELNDGEVCDEDTDLCNGCQIECPSGWFQLGNSCFAVALNDVSPYDAFTADAKCGALAVGGSGHRAHAAVPASLEELAELATRCPNDGCWIGFFALGPPQEGTFTAPSTGESLLASPPWNVGEPSGGDDDICLKLLASDGEAFVEDQPCSGPGYFACELETTFGSFSTCNDGVLDPGEECDDAASDACVDCDRRCLAGWSEDPRTHTCLLPIAGPATWTEAAATCTDAGARLATPDQVADVRVASAVTSNAWIGLEATGIINPPIPGWISGESFDFTPGVYPLPEGPTEVSHGVLTADGEIVFDVSDQPRGALCEAYDPDD